MAIMNRNRRGYKGRKRYARKYISKRKAVRRAKKSNFVRAVRKVIREQVEDKMAWYNGTLVKYNSGIDVIGDITSILPAIANGTTSASRIGDQIRGKSLNVRGHVRLDYLNTSNQTNMTQVAVRLMVVSLKPGPNYTYSQNTTAPLSSLLDKGGVVSGFTGALQDLYCPINSKVWTKHYDKVMFLSQTYINQPATAGLNTVATDASKSLRFFNINVPCKKVMNFDPNISVGLFPTDFNPVILLGYSFLDNSTPDTVNTRVAMQFTSTFNFEDA